MYKINTFTQNQLSLRSCVLTASLVVALVSFGIAPFPTGASAGEVPSTKARQIQTLKQNLIKANSGGEAKDQTVSCSVPPYFASVCPSVLKSACKGQNGTMSESGGTYTCTLTGKRK